MLGSVLPPRHTPNWSAPLWAGRALRSVFHSALSLAAQCTCHDAGQVARQLGVRDDAGDAEPARFFLRIEVHVRAEGDDGDATGDGGGDARAPIYAAGGGVDERDGWRRDVVIERA